MVEDEMNNDNISYRFGDIVLATLQGYPQWPAMVINPDTTSLAPVEVPDNDTKFYCVRFLPSGNCMWLVSTALSLLQRHEIEAFLNANPMSSDYLFQAYQAAMNPHEWKEGFETQLQATQVNGDGDYATENVDLTKKRKRENESSSVGSGSLSEAPSLAHALEPSTTQQCATFAEALSGKLSRLRNPTSPLNSVEGDGKECLTTAMAIDRLGTKLMDFADVLREVLVSPRPRADTDAERKSRARDILQRNETHLGPNEMLALLTLFTRDADVADMYVEITNVEYRKLWITQQLAELGFTGGA